MIFLIWMLAFTVIIFVAFPFIWYKRNSSAKKQIQKEAEDKNWKNVKVKNGWWDFIVTYKYEDDTIRKTHCTVWWKKIIWLEDNGSGYLFPEASSTRIKWWKAVAIISGICFLYLSIGYEFEQITWLVYKYSFAKNGYAVKIGRQYAVGVDQIIRGEQAYRQIKISKPDQVAPKEGNEYLILTLKVKNIVRKTNSSLSLYVREIETKSKSFFGDYYDRLDIENSPWSTDQEPETLDISYGEIKNILSVFEVPLGAPIQNITISADYNYDFDSYTIPFSKSPFRGTNSSAMSIFFSFFSIAISLSSKRMHLVWQKGFKKRYIFLPFILYFFLMMTVWVSTTSDFYRVMLMLFFFYISWGSIFNLSTTKVKEE